MFFLIAALFIFSAAFAQERTAPVSVTNPIEAIQDGATLRRALPNIDNPPSRAPGDVAFNEEFTGTTFPPAGWTITTTGSTTILWTRSTTQVHSAGGSAYHNYSSSSSVSLNGWLITPAITVPSADFNLSFWSYTIDGSYAPSNGSTICVSTTDNQTGSFTTVKTLSYSGGEMSAAWQQFTISLAAYAGQTIYIAFHYQGAYAHAWYLDDVKVSEPAENDIAISAVPYPYSQIPQSQNLTQTLNATIKNNGTLAQSDVQLDVALNNTPIGTSAVQASLAPSASANFSVAASGLPILLGDNTLKYEASQTQTDQVPGDNIVLRNFTGTNFTFANDAGEEAYTTVFGSTTSTVTAGNVYTFTKPTTVYQAQFFSYSGYAATTLNFAIYSMPTATTTSSTAVYTQNSIARPAATQWNNINFTTPQTLAAGSYYFALTQTSSSGHMSVLGDANSEGRLAYTRSGTNLTAATASMMLRINVDLEDNNLVLTANGFPYTKIPASQAAALPFPSPSGKVFNFGKTAQTNVTLSATLNGTPIGTATVASLASLATADMSVTLNAGAAFSTTVGVTHNVHYKVTQDQTDAFPNENKEEDYSFEITQDVYAVDAVTDLNAYGVGYSAANAIMGNYFTITQTTVLKQVMVAFGLSNQGLAYNIQLYAKTGANTIAATPLFSQASTIVSGAWATVNVPATVLYPGDYYLCIQQSSTTNPGLLYDGVQGRYCYGTTSGTTLTQQLNFGSVALRMVIEEPVYVNITTNVSPAGSGTVTGGGQCILGTSATLTAVANLGYLFQQWSDGVTANPRIITVTGPATYTAVFETFPMDACMDPKVGSGTTTSTYLPAQNYYNRGYAQQIYSAAELGLPFTGPVLITSISFQYTNATALTWTNQTIYLGNTTKSTFDSNTDFIPVGQLEQVYSGSITYNNTNAWYTIQLQTPFIYTGGNVVVGYLNNHGSYNTSGTFLVHAETNKAIYCGYDTPSTTILDPANPTANGTPTRPTNRSNFQLHACGLLPNMKDMKAVSITGSTTPMALYTENYVVTVRNNGSLPASNYKVSIVTDGGEELATQTVTTTLAPLAEYVVTFPITFLQTMAGPLTINGVVTFAGDEVPGNNEVSLAINVTPHPGFDLDCSNEAPITTATYTTGYYLPLNNLYNRSYTQQIFDAAEIGLASGTIINAVAFLPTHSTSNVYTKTGQSIYLANTTKSTFTGATDYIAASELQLVFSGDVTFNHNANPTWQALEFNVAPFTYTGGNIAVIYVNNHHAYASVNTFRTGSSGSVTGKTTTLYTDNNTTISPSAIPSGTGVNTSTYTYRAHTKFIACEKLYTLHPLNIPDPKVTLNPDPVPDGQTAVVNFYPEDACHYITEVFMDGVSIGNVTSYNFGGAPITNVLPYFEVVTAAYQYTITSSVNSAGNNGTISPLGVNSFDCGENVIYLMLPDPGYKVGQIFVDGVAITNPMNKYTFFDLDANHTIEVTFVECPFTIYFEKIGEGSIFQQFTNGDSNEIMGSSIGVDYGMSHFTFVPAPHYILQAVYIDGINNLGATLTGSYIFPNVTSNHTVKVIFKLEEFNILATAGTNGAITPSGNQAVPYGTNKHFDFAPNTGYTVDQVFINNVANPAAAAAGYYDFVNVTENQTIHVTFKKATLVIHISWNEGGAIDPVGNTYTPTGANSGDVYVLYNDIQKLTFVPQTGYKVSMVYVNGVEYPNAILTGSYTFYYITHENWFHVVFEKYTYPITALINGNGMISDYGTTYVAHGDNKSYTFYPMTGYKIEHVFIDGYDNEAAIANGSHTFTNVTAPHTIDVVTAPLTYKITAMAGTGGFITPEGVFTVNYGDNKFFTFVAASGYEIEKVLVDGLENTEALQNGAYAFVNIKEDHTINVFCKLLKFSIASLAGPNGSIEPAGITELNFGEDITYTIFPNEGYKISYVLVNGDNMGAIDTYTFAAIEADGDIEVFFAPVEIVGIDNPTIDGLNIYSNTNVVYIVNEKHIAISDVSIFDMYGRVVWQGKPVESRIVLNVANGIYTVRVATEDNFTTSKVSIQR